MKTEQTEGDGVLLLHETQTLPAGDPIRTHPPTFEYSLAVKSRS